jgi:DNA end-binding protein Ku
MARRTNRATPSTPRALWKGTLAVGLVNIPVSLHRAVRRRGVPFHELHEADGGRIRRREVCAIDGALVPHGHVVKGLEIERGRWITVTDEELQALEPRASRAIEIVAFVDPHEIDPIFYERTYWLVPDEDTGHAALLLGAAMAGLHRVGIARFTMRARQHLATIRPVQGEGGASALALSTLGYADEILPLAELGLTSAKAAPDARELSLAERLVDSLSGRFQPERYHDEHRDKVLSYLRERAEGRAPAVAPLPAPASPPGDLVGALSASVAEAERRRTAA